MAGGSDVSLPRFQCLGETWYECCLIESSAEDSMRERENVSTCLYHDAWEWKRTESEIIWGGRKAVEMESVVENVKTYCPVGLAIKLWVQTKGNSVQSCGEWGQVTAEWAAFSDKLWSINKSIEYLWFPGHCCQQVCPSCPLVGGCGVCDSVYHAEEEGCCGNTWKDITDKNKVKSLFV